MICVFLIKLLGGGVDGDGVDIGVGVVSERNGKVFGWASN